MANGCDTEIKSYPWWSIHVFEAAFLFNRFSEWVGKEVHSLSRKRWVKKALIFPFMLFNEHNEKKGDDIRKRKIAKKNIFTTPLDYWMQVGVEDLTSSRDMSFYCVNLSNKNLSLPLEEIKLIVGNKFIHFFE